MPRVFQLYWRAVLSLLCVAQVKGLDYTYSFDCNPSATLDDYDSSLRSDKDTYVNPAVKSCVNIFRGSYNVLIQGGSSQSPDATTGNTFTPQAQLPGTTGAISIYTPPFNVIRDCCNGGCRGCFIPAGGKSCVYRVWKTGETNIKHKGRCLLCEQVNCNSYCLNGQVNIPNPLLSSRRALTSVPTLLTDGSPVRHQQPCKPPCHSNFGNT
jgi:hypothetical protein